MNAMKRVNGKRFILQLALLAAGIVMMVLGLARGEAFEIFQKGIIVCLECIGIG